ncbi:MDR family MFS transporter [Nocardia sp. CNY236]|uniref:MDR family MFS transporter n=1 Tax=Nocardia sp. CNY236 TaxID=1169152 RepID=UPI0004016BFE|nr:MDR family MFS transporter [Nocardia sp. CNY236]
MSQQVPITTAPPPTATTPTGAGITAAIVALILAMMLATLDNMIIGTAIPTIVGELGGLDDLSWVITSYTLATAASTPIWGKLGDMYGRKGVFLASIVIFLVGSALSGLAQDLGQLIGFRALQGLGGGGLMVSAFAIMGELIPPRDRAKYQGVMSAAMGATMIGGPLVGGLITDHFGWRWCFLINLPIGLVGLTLVATGMRLPARRAQGRVDYLGATLLAFVISVVVLVSAWGGTRYDWGSAVIVGLGLAAVLATAGFLLVERQAREPVLPLGIFQVVNFSLATVIGLLVGFVLFSTMTFLTLYQQAVQGASATNSGLLLLPVLLSMVVVNVIVGQWITKGLRLRTVLRVGSALMTVSLFLMATMGTGTSRLVAALYMVVLGAGMGCLIQGTLLLSLDSVGMRNLGVASSTATLSRTVGGTLGVAASGALFAHQVQQSLAARGPEVASAVSGDAVQLTAAAMARLPEGVRVAYEHAVADGARLVFVAAALLSVAALLGSWFVRQRALAPAPTDAA